MFNLLKPTKNQRENNRGEGFTLIELLVVIAIISLLSSVVLASLSSARERARVARTVSDFKQIETAMTLWMQSEGKTQWPTESEIGQGNLPTLEEVASATTLDRYLTSVPGVLFDENENYLYYYPGSPRSDCNNVYAGISILVNDIGSIERKTVEQINQIIDGNETNHDCGKFSFNDVSSGTAFDLFYYLSVDQSF